MTLGGEGMTHGFTGAAARYARMFGLADNPFSPVHLPLLPDGTQPTVRLPLRGNLHKEPLPVDEQLFPEYLLVQEAGDFAAYQQKFQNTLERYADDPVATGEQFVFLVCGEQGTGKSTMIRMMVRWLKQCHVDWSPIYWSGSPRGKDLYRDLSRELDGTPEESYCYLVLEELTAGDISEALQVFYHYSKSRVLIMFLETHDLKYLAGPQENLPADVTRFRMSPLTPDQAVAFARQRIDQFRMPELRGALAGYPLFPFLEEDIRNAVADNRAGVEGGRGAITLRSFASILQRILRESFPASGDDAELATLPAEKLAGRIIDLAYAYSRLGEVAA